MHLLASWNLSQDATDRRIELYRGDLSRLGPEHAVDILVVSAFRNDYVPTPTSLIGALHRNGVSVHNLSFAKAQDLRDEFGCWISHSVGASSFDRLLCVESGWQGTPPELADSLFRALVPISISNIPTRTVAMPLIGAGDQGYGAGRMMAAVLRAAVGWFRRGMPLDVLKIVAYSEADARLAKDRFLEIQREDAEPREREANWDVFLSYSSKDQSAAKLIGDLLTSSAERLRVFRDKPSLQKGQSWIMQIADAIDTSRCIVSLYSPSYWDSVVCRDELSAAYVRQLKAEKRLLYPIFYRDTQIPSFFEAMHYDDCREADHERLAEICQDIAGSVRS
ncbi:hypothetical protein ABI59_05350 [Acidobacteria bacterium Mor1]|nr:hypothetical protein ABI59_05350 [Acidobacteria bacterium Mor1]